MTSKLLLHSANNAQVCHLLQVDVATICNLPKTIKTREHGLASYASILAMGGVGNMALGLATGVDVASVRSLQGPHFSTHRQHEHFIIALVWGFPLDNKEYEICTMMQKVFLEWMLCQLTRAQPLLISKALIFVHQYLVLMLQSMNPRAGEKGTQHL